MKILLSYLQDPIWQFFGAIIAILVPTILYLRQRSIKKLAYSIVSDAPILTLGEGVEGKDVKVEVLYKRKQQKEVSGQVTDVEMTTQIKNARLLIFDLWNAGNREVTKEDYEGNPIKFYFRGANIINFGVLNTWPEHFKDWISVVQEVDALSLQPILLNKNYKVRLKVLLDGYTPGEMTVKSLIAGIDEILLVQKTERAPISNTLIAAGFGYFLMIMVLSVFILAIAQALLINLGISFNVNDLLLNQVFFDILLGGSAILAAFITLIIWRKDIQKQKKS